ncbi:uncharacterized protein [Macrobrachium rosenbergii]|uniref:uncharacterized protein n=1 Tax=Macrobrachium rosenbergii TaxID=79674 RepID=UPI0034D5BAF8
MDDTNSKMFYAEGPQGQRVVIVPPGIQTETKVQKLAWYYCCFIFTISVAFFCLLVGSVYAGIDISISNTFVREYGPLTSVGFIFLSIGVLFVVVSIICFRRAGRVKAKRVLQYMHRDDPGGRRTPEELHRDEYGIGYEMRAAAPDASQSYYRTYYDTPPLQPLIPTGPSPEITGQLHSS